MKRIINIIAEWLDALHSFLSPAESTARFNKDYREELEQQLGKEAGQEFYNSVMQQEAESKNRKKK